MGSNLNMAIYIYYELSIFWLCAKFYQNVNFYKIIYCPLKSTVILLSKSQ